MELRESGFLDGEDAIGFEDIFDIGEGLFGVMKVHENKSGVDEVSFLVRESGDVV